LQAAGQTLVSGGHYFYICMWCVLHRTFN